MIKSCSVMESVQQVCSELRVMYFGTQASAADFKDSYVINQSIENFSVSPMVLMEEEITTRDQSEKKVSKSINFRSSCYEKITLYSRQLHTPESEILRRILYFSLIKKAVNHANTPSSPQIAALKGKAELLKTQIEASMVTLNELMDAIAELESKEKADNE